MQEAFQQVLESLKKWQPKHDISLESLQQAGSNRQYFRFQHEGRSYISLPTILPIPLRTMLLWNSPSISAANR